MPINFGFSQKKPRDSRLPPGQYLTPDFPVLSQGPTPQLEISNWQLAITGLAKPLTFTWDELLKLPKTQITADIHCVTKWSKFDTHWTGVSLKYLLDLAQVSPSATHLIAHSADSYTTNIPIQDIKTDQAIVAYEYDNKPIPTVHGGPVRLVIPHLYFWKSAKWVTKLEFTDHDIPGFWETRGYHNYGDPWNEERYS